MYLLAAAVCLWPAAAGAQPPNPTASDGNGNTAAGTDALLVVTGFSNSAIGAGALRNTTTGNDNTAAGDGALISNTTGSHNAAAGYRALYFNTTGSFNTAAGFIALLNNTTGGSNTAAGAAALVANTVGGYNTASGADALHDNTTGSNNVALGYQALYTNETGNNNVAVGRGALARIKGTTNIALGFNAGKSTKIGNSNIYIGHPGINGNESRVTRIGTVQKEVFIAGIAGVPGNGAHVVVRANGQLGVVASSARYKRDIEPLDEMAGRLAQLRPVSYRYKAEPDALHYGLIAEEVATVMPELVIRDGDNRPDSVQYMDLIPLLLQQWKAQQARLERQETELAALRRTLATRLAANGGKLD